MREHCVGVIAAAVVLAGTIQSARADRIDGSWCRPEGDRMTINGPSIVTPAGTATTGDYSRHAFSYVVPQGDPGAGGTIRMILANEDTVLLRTAQSAEPEIWHRCGPPVSQLWPPLSLS